MTEARPVRAASRNGSDWWRKPPREQAIRGEGVLPAIHYAVDAYVQWVSTRSLLEAVASSLTELFSGKLIALRMEALRKHYPWLVPGLAYFEARISQAPEDAAFAVDWVYRHAETREQRGARLCGPRRRVRHSLGRVRRPPFRVRGAGLAPSGRVLS